MLLKLKKLVILKLARIIIEIIKFWKKELDKIRRKWDFIISTKKVYINYKREKFVNNFANILADISPNIKVHF